MLKRKFYMCTNEVKSLLYKSFCTNFYCTQLWWKYSPESLRKLKVAYNNGLRKFLGIPKYSSASDMFVSNNILSFLCLRRKSVYSFMMRLQSCDNNMTKCFYNRSVLYKSPSLVEWVKMLYKRKFTLE